MKFKSAGERLLMLLGVVTLMLWAVEYLPAVAGEPAQDRSRVTQRGCPEPATAGTAAKKGEVGQNAGAAKESGGFRVYIDPQTRQFVEPPTDQPVAPTPPPAAVSTSAEGLVETPNPEPGGGVMMDLKGRFRSPVTATVGPDGKARIQHGPCDPVSDSKK